MQTTDFITLIQGDCNGAATRDEIRIILDLVQQEMLAKDIQYMRAVPDILLETTSDVLVYQLPEGIRSCVGIYIPNTRTNSNELPYKIDGQFNYMVKNAVVADPGDGNPPTVLFTQPPSDSSTAANKYACVCYRAPGRILDENDVIEVPDPHTTGYLRTRVMEFIEQRKFGNSIYWSNQAKKDRGEWLRWANQNQYDPNHGTNTDYLSGDSTAGFYGGRRSYGRYY